MDAERHVNVALPDDLAEMVREKVAAGDYADEGEVVRAGLALLAERDEAVEGWLHARVASTYDRLRASPESALSADEIRQALDAEAHPER